MKITIATLLICIVLMGCSESNNPQDRESSKQLIREFYGKWFGAMESADIDEFLSLLTEDFYIKTPGQPAITDTAELRKGLQEYHQTFASSVDWEIEDIQFHDKQAIVRIREEVSLVNRQSNDTSKYRGVHLALLEKTADGWKVKTDVSSLNQ